MEHRLWRRVTAFLAVAICILFTGSRPVEAVTVNSDAQARKVMEQAFENGDLELVITVNMTLSVERNVAEKEIKDYAKHLVELLEQAALNNSKVMDGYSYKSEWSGNKVTYRFDISDTYAKKVTILKSEKDAYKKALKALKKRDYKTKFYCGDAKYYEVFMKVLEQHPEYNYAVARWRNSDGDVCGFQSTKLTTAQIKTKMSKANKKADAILSKIIRKDMNTKEKITAIHDYLVVNCKYYEGNELNSASDVYTAYGCLVNGTAVCQGYAAAFNLLVSKAGIRSIAVCGSAGGGSHAWNYVKCGNEYRYVDVTWDDPVPDRGPNGNISTKYFYVTESQLERTHRWTKTDYTKKYVDYS